VTGSHSSLASALSQLAVAARGPLRLSRLQRTYPWVSRKYAVVQSLRLALGTVSRQDNHFIPQMFDFGHYQFDHTDRLSVEDLY